MTEQLLRDYVQTGSESAFRYINLVYSTAYRRLGGDAHLAQDTVQVVFSDLAQKSIGESPGVPPYRPQMRYYLLRPTGDGSYEAKDVLPGEYRVHAQVLSQAVPGGPFALEALGNATVTVPDGEAGVIEIGEVQLSRPPQAGN